MKEMFEASVDGQAYDAERWGQYFRPAGVSAPAATAQSATVPTVVSAAPVVSATPVTSDFDEDDAPAITAPVSKPAATGGQNAQDILAMIRARQTKT